MPRLTKKQKEAGRAKKESAKKNPTNKGFNVLPARAGRDAYLGKARKIKADLIERAKIKKQYAKVLAETGGKSERLKAQKGQAHGKPAVKKAETWSAVDDDTLKPEAEEAEDDGADSDAESVASDASSALGLGGERRDDDSDDEAAAFAAREKALLRGKGRPERPARPAKGKVDGDRRKSVDGQRAGAVGKAPRAKGKERPKPYARDGRDGRDGRERPPHLQRRGQPEKKERPVRALSPPKLPEPKAGSMREIKKEGFGKFNRTPTGKKQPNMAARMDVLLEKIRRAK